MLNIVDVIFLLFVLVMCIGIVLRHFGCLNICLNHRPKTLKLVDPLTPSQTHLISRCPNCKHIKYVEERP